MTKYETRLFIGDEYVEPKEGKTFELLDPFTGQLLANVGEATKVDVDRAVELAKPAAEKWAEVSAKERATCLRKLASLMQDNIEELVSIEATSGKPELVKHRLIANAVNGLEWLATLAETVSGTSSLATPGLFNVSIKQPFGVTAGILPFNAPVLMFVSKAGAAVAAGNAIIIKTSEKAPLGVIAVCKYFKEAGFPPGLIQVLNGGGETGKLLSEHMEIRKISFTGSGVTGKKVAAAAMNSNMKNVTLELGGKSPLIIFPDADLEAAALASSMSVLGMTGQACNAISRIYVHADVYDQFLTAYKAKFATASSWMGPVVDKVQFDRISAYLDTGKQEGQLLIGGSRDKDQGFYLQPTIFTDVPHNAKINQEEIFGPVSVVHKFTDENEAIKAANDTEYGLWAAVYTKDITRALNLAKKLEAGHVTINASSPTTAMDMPFGGWKQSGIGRELGLKALDHWLEEKSVIIKLD